MNLLTAPDEAAAGELLHEFGCTDGLPVIVPTEARVSAMLAGRDPDEIVGVVAPRMGVARLGDVAASAVMAGCAPAHLPIVVAAVRAVCQPRFTLDVVQGTTHNAAVLLIVSGSARDTSPPLARSTGALGPGFRANASIGRALRLVLINAGGGTPGAGDMSTLGQPAKFTCCVAEADHALGPLVAAPAVTAVACEGPNQVFFVPVGDGAALDAARLLDLLAATIAVPGSLGAVGYSASAAIVLSPLHADVLVASGYGRASIADALYDRASLTGESVRQRHGFIRGGDRELVHALASPAHLTLAVAGGAGTYSAVFCGLSAGIGEACSEPVL